MTIKVWFGKNQEEREVKKDMRGSCIVKAQISFRDGRYYFDRTVYVDTKGFRYIKVNGCWFDLTTYSTDPRYMVKIWF